MQDQALSLDGNFLSAMLGMSCGLVCAGLHAKIENDESLRLRNFELLGICVDRSNMDTKFRFLDHTADAKFQAFGRTLEEAFSNAALATASLMWDVESVEKKVRRKVGVRGRDLEQLLLHFLEEVIYAFETGSFLLASVEDLKIEPESDGRYCLEAVFAGDDAASKYALHGEVKAITYNEMRIQENDPITLQVVVDI